MTHDAQRDELIELAAIMRAHGLRGELLLKVFNPDSELLFEATEIVLRSPDGARHPYRVESAHQHGGSVLYALEGVETREQADALRGSLICVPREVLPALEQDEHYFVDLVGALASDEQGKPVGKLVDLHDYPSVCCFVIETTEGRVEVPYTDRYVPSLDAAGKTLVVAHLDELDVLREKPIKPKFSKKRPKAAGPKPPPKA